MNTQVIYVFFSVSFLLIFENVTSSRHDRDNAPKVSIFQGTLKGKIKTNLFGKSFYSFQGIPYAKPPVAELRFKPSIPAGPWKGVLDATVEGPSCTQLSDDQQVLNSSSEDCLYINVYTPKIPKSRHEPLKSVLVFIYGGGFTIGSGGTDMYGPEWLLTEDIVFVAFNYRLNVFGFLSFDDPSVQVPGNNGLKDMVLALKWVQKNIKAFGGDPNCVTIYGESSGAVATHLMMLSKRTHGLFHRAIMSSGVADIPSTFPGRNYKELVRVLGYSGNELNQQEMFTFLKSKSTEELLKAQTIVASNIREDRYIGEATPFGTVIENSELNPDAFITEIPTSILESGKYHHVPILMGMNTDEGLVYKFDMEEEFANGFNDTEKLVPKFLNLTRGTELNKQVGNKISQFYFGNVKTKADITRKVSDLMTDVAFAWDIVRTTKIMITKQKEKVYFYQFAYITELNYLSKLVQAPFPSAAHADELGYLFPIEWRNLGPVDPNSEEMRGIRRMVKLWSNFVRFGDPNSYDNNPLLNITWPVTKKGENFQYLIIQPDLTIGSSLIPQRLKFWQGLVDSLRSGNPI